MPYLEKFAAQYGQEINCLFVYIEEAHAQDEWPIGSAVVQKQHRTWQERLGAAEKLGVSSNWMLLLDTMENTFAAAFSPWPFRYYLFDRQRCAQVIAQPIEASLPLSEIWAAAEKILQ